MLIVKIQTVELRQGNDGVILLLSAQSQVQTSITSSAA